MEGGLENGWWKERVKVGWVDVDGEGNDNLRWVVGCVLSSVEGKVLFVPFFLEEAPVNNRYRDFIDCHK